MPASMGTNGPLDAQTTGGTGRSNRRPRSSRDGSRYTLPAPRAVVGGVPARAGMVYGAATHKWNFAQALPVRAPDEANVASMSVPMGVIGSQRGKGAEGRTTACPDWLNTSRGRI